MLVLFTNYLVNLIISFIYKLTTKPKEIQKFERRLNI